LRNLQDVNSDCFLMDNFLTRKLYLKQSSSNFNRAFLLESISPCPHGFTC